METPLFTFSPVEEYVISVLANKPSTALELVGLYSGPKQSIYKALRSLVSKKVLASTNGVFSLLRLWVDAVVGTLMPMQLNHDPIFNMTPGEQVVYTFKDFDSCDQYFIQIFWNLNRIISADTPLLFHNLHQWFYAVKPDSEQAFWGHLCEQGFTSYMTVSGVTPLDKYIGGTLFATNPQLRFSLMCKALSAQTVSMVCMIGDIIIEVTPEKSRTRAIDTWFKNNTTITPENTAELSEIITRRGVVKMKITNDPIKTAQYRKRIMSNFA